MSVVVHGTPFNGFLSDNRARLYDCVPPRGTASLTVILVYSLGDEYTSLNSAVLRLIGGFFCQHDRVWGGLEARDVRIFVVYGSAPVSLACRYLCLVEGRDPTPIVYSLRALMFFIPFVCPRIFITNLKEFVAETVRASLCKFNGLVWGERCCVLWSGMTSTDRLGARRYLLPNKTKSISIFFDFALISL